MSFLNISAFGFLGLIPVIILFYLLKLKRKEITVPSILLWKSSVKDLEASTPLQKLRRNLLLFLQLLFLLFLILALARPFLKKQARTGENIILIMDCSASMKSREMGLTRFEAARKAAIKLIKDLSKNDRAMIISSSSKTVVECTFASDKELLAKTLAELSPKDTPSNIRDAYLLAASTARTLGKAEVFILSDGAIGQLPKTELEKIHFLSFGKEASNLAITALDVRRKPSSRFDYELFVSVENFSVSQEEFYLGLYSEDKILNAVKINLRPGMKKSHIFSGFGTRTHLLRVELDQKDDLELDNKAWAVLEPKKELSILIVSDGNPFLEKLLNLEYDTKVSLVSPSGYSPSLEYGLTIFDSYAPPETGEGNYVFINPPPSMSPVPASGYVDRPIIVDWEKTHPLLRYVDLSDVHIAKALGLKQTSEAKTMVEGDRSSLISIFSKGNSKIVLIGFSLSDSDWVLRASFPIFFSNLLSWLESGLLTTSLAQVRSGETFSFPVGREDKNITIIEPGGRELTIGASGGMAHFDDTFKAGLYEARFGGRRKFFAVNLLNDEESRLEHSSSLEIGGRTVTASTSGALINEEFWRGFVIFGLVVLMVEWYFYHRRP